MAPKPFLAQFPFLGPTTAAGVASAIGPSGLQWVYVDEFDATYRWNAGSAVAVDNFRVLGHTGGVAGRWILDGTKLTLSPRGAGLDDWARLRLAMVAMAYFGEIQLNAGAWRCDTKQTTPSGTILFGGPGVVITSTLIPNAPGGAEDASPFYNSGGTEFGNTTTLTVNANQGDTTITVASAAGIAIGNRINLRNGVIRVTAREVTNIVGNVLTLDRPILRPFVIGNGVAVLPTCRDIKIHGNGMQVRGTGDRVVEFISAWDCLVEDVIADVTMNFFVFGYDVGSRDSHFVRCVVDCNTTTPAAFALEYAEECSVQDGYSFRASTYNVFLVGCDNCYIRGGYHTEGGALGMFMGVNAATDTLGCRGCVIEGTAFTKHATQGVSIQDGSSFNTLVGVETSDNAVGILFTPGTSASPPAFNTITGGVARRNVTAAVFCSTTGKGNKVIGQNAEDNGGTVGNGNVYVAAAGSELTLVGCAISDSGVLSTLRGMILASGIGAVVRVSGVYATTTRVAGVAVFCEVQGTAKLFVDGATEYRGTAASLGIFVASGVARVSGFTCIAPGGSGFFITGATAFARVADDVDVSATATPFFSAGGAAYNRSVVPIALTGAAPLAIAFGDTTATDRLFVTAVALAVGPGVVFTGAPIVGVGFNVVGAAGDTSTFHYDIH